MEIKEFKPGDSVIYKTLRRSRGLDPEGRRALVVSQAATTVAIKIGAGHIKYVHPRTLTKIT